MFLLCRLFVTTDKAHMHACGHCMRVAATATKTLKPTTITTTPLITNIKHKNVFAVDKNDAAPHSALWCVAA